MARVTAELGSPEGFSAELGGEAEPRSTVAAGRVLGVPYDWRVPTAERVAERLWSPRDPRILMPRIWGIGWDINFGAVAVRLHLIEPDSEDVPFASTPNSAFLAALAVPVVLTSAMLVSYLMLRSTLPAMLPSHWNFQGVADGFWTQERRVRVPVPDGAAAHRLGGAGRWCGCRPALLRGAVIGFAAFFAALGALLWLLTLITVLTGFYAWWLPPLLIAIGFAVPFVVLLWLARAGRKAEQQRDFANAS